MDKELEKKRLSQTKTLEYFMKEVPLTAMLTVCSFEIEEQFNRGLYCALVPVSQKDTILSHLTWDLREGEGLPSSVKYGNSEEATYLRFGEDNGIEPLVIYREFNSIRKSYHELSEEFRLFHRLYHDLKTNEYIKFDEAGNETVVATISQDTVKIRLKELRQFLAIKNVSFTSI